MTVTFPSSRTVRRAGWGVLLLALACVAWFAATLETGVDTLAQDLHDATFGRLGADLQQLTQPTANQFWIDLVSADIAREPESVDRLLEGAYLLYQLPIGLGGFGRNGGNLLWNDPRLAATANRWLVRAGEIAPDDPRVWRARFRLDNEFTVQTGFKVYWIKDIPLLRLWQQAATRDSANALYDYVYWVSGRHVTNLEQLDQTDEIRELAALITWFESRRDGVDQLPRLDDGGNATLYASRAIARLPLSRMERHHILTSLREPYSALTTLLQAFRDSDQELRNLPAQLQSRSLSAPWLDAWIRYHEAELALLTLKDALRLGENRQPGVSLEEAKSRCVNAGVEWNIADNAVSLAKQRRGWGMPDSGWYATGRMVLTQLKDRNRSFGPVLPWLTRSTRARLLILAGLLLLLGALTRIVGYQRTASTATTGTTRLADTPWLVLRISAALLVGLTISVIGLWQCRGANHNLIDGMAQDWDLIDGTACLSLVGAVVLYWWGTVRVSRSQRLTRRSSCVAVIAGIVTIVCGWGTLYWFHREKYRQLLEPWTREIHAPFQWFIEQDSQIPWYWHWAVVKSSWRFFISQGLPLGFALGALFWFGWIITTTRPAGGRSFCDWFLAREPQVAPGAPALPWGIRVVHDLSAAGCAYGLWALCVWAVASACEMQSFDALYQRQFHSRTTDADLWEDYQQALSDIRSDERALADLRKQVAEQVDRICAGED